MIIETTPNGAEQRPTSATSPDRRLEALVAAYIHELSPRHHAARQGADAEDGDER
jgi:hypothetical protein